MTMPLTSILLDISFFLLNFFFFSSRRRHTRLVMAGLLGLILAEVVVGHVTKANPNRECQAQPPRKHDAPEDPIRHTEDQAHFCRRPAIAHEVTDHHTPDQTRGPKGHDEQSLAASVTEELLFFVAGFVRVRHGFGVKVGYRGFFSRS